MHLMARSLLASSLALVLAAPALAQEEAPAPTTISAIERGEVQGLVYLEGAALGAAEDDDDDEYVFSDGTGTITIDVDESAGADQLPLFELIGIEGTLERDEMDVSRWAVLRIMTPAVIVEEPQVIEAFRGWIIAYDSQAPDPAE